MQLQKYQGRIYGMAVLIPSKGRCTFDTRGEERLEQKLDDGYLLWFKSVGIQTQGRTTILKINYRNTRQILHTASLVAADLLTADDKDDDGIPMLKPVSCRCEGQATVIIKLPTLRDEAFAIADHLASAHKEGFAWGDMAVLFKDLCPSSLEQRKLTHRVRKRSGNYEAGAGAIQVMTMKVSKGLEFPVVARCGVGTCLRIGRTRSKRRECFMWRRRGKRRDCRLPPARPEIWSTTRLMESKSNTYCRFKKPMPKCINIAQHSEK